MTVSLLSLPALVYNIPAAYTSVHHVIFKEQELQGVFILNKKQNNPSGLPFKCIFLKIKYIRLIFIFYIAVTFQVQITNIQLQIELPAG